MERDCSFDPFAKLPGNRIFARRGKGTGPSTDTCSVPQWPQEAQKAELFAKFGTGIYSGNGRKRHKKHKKNGTMRNDQGLRALRDIK